MPKDPHVELHTIIHTSCDRCTLGGDLQEFSAVRGKTDQVDGLFNCRILSEGDVPANSPFELNFGGQVSSSAPDHYDWPGYIGAGPLALPNPAILPGQFRKRRPLPEVSSPTCERRLLLLLQQLYPLEA